MTIRRQIIYSNILMLLVPMLLMIIAAVVMSVALFINSPHNSFISPKDIYLFLYGISPNSVIFRCITLFVLFFILTVIITSACITAVLSKKILVPIKELTAAAYKIKNGQLDFELLGSRCREINELCSAFDNMRLQLRESRNTEERQLVERRLMLANISHDIKTPLTSIKGYISGIKDGIASSPEKLAKYLDTIYKKTEVMENIINNMSDLSMLELSKLNFNFEYGNIAALIKTMCDEYEFDRPDVKISADIPQNMTVRMDCQKMRRVFSNIIDNSIKYAKSGGCEITVNAEENDSGFVISVADNGIGIDSGNIGHVFDVFYRADPSRTPNIKGTGLGLAIVREIIESHGGNIWIKSKESVGTTVYIFLRRVD